jgi:hypothetical protein
MNVEACAKVNASDLIAFTPQSDTYYTRLPTDALDIEWDVSPSRDFSTLCDLVAADNTTLADVGFMDEVFLAAFRHAQRHEALAAATDWPAVQLATTRAYTRHLNVGEAGRPIRMRAGRLSFFLADLIDRSSRAEGTVLRTLSYRNPWDWVDGPKSCWIDCADRNFHFSDGRKMALGKPTQIDLCGTKLALGSCYSPGAYLVDENGSVEFLDRPIPLVLVADHSELGRIEVSRDGRVILTNKGFIGQLPCAAIWRARLIGDHIYASDWSETNQLIRFSLLDGTAEKLNCAPVMVCNDIVAHGKGYALLDKFQGHVFFFDARWRFLHAEMAFGKTPGRLFDPIALKSVESGDVQVVNWMGGEIVAWKNSMMRSSENGLGT